MHEMQTIVTDMCSVCLIISLFVCLLQMHRMTPHIVADLRRLHCVGLFGAAFAKWRWPLVTTDVKMLKGR